MDKKWRERRQREKESQKEIEGSLVMDISNPGDNEVCFETQKTGGKDKELDDRFDINIAKDNGSKENTCNKGDAYHPTEDIGTIGAENAVIDSWLGKYLKNPVTGFDEDLQVEKSVKHVDTGVGTKEDLHAPPSPETSAMPPKKPVLEANKSFLLSSFDHVEVAEKAPTPVPVTEMLQPVQQAVSKLSTLSGKPSPSQIPQDMPSLDDSSLLIEETGTFPQFKSASFLDQQGGIVQAGHVLGNLTGAGLS